MAAKKKAAKKKTAKQKTASKTAANAGGPCGAVNNKGECRPSPRPCPTTVKALCEEVRHYMRCNCEWGFDLAQELKVLKLRVDACCGGGGPGDVPKPPPPPF